MACYGNSLTCQKCANKRFFVNTGVTLQACIENRDSLVDLLLRAEPREEPGVAGDVPPEGGPARRRVPQPNAGPPDRVLGGERGVGPPVLAEADLLHEGAADVPADLDEVQVVGRSHWGAVVGHVGAGRSLALYNC